MNRQEELNRAGQVFDAWVDKYAANSGFDPNNPTAEQATEYYNLLKEEFGQVGQGEFAEQVANMSEEELAELRKLPIYSDTYSIG